MHLLPAQSTCVTSAPSHCLVCAELASVNYQQMHLCQALECRLVAEKQLSMPAFHFKQYLRQESARIQARRRSHRQYLEREAKDLAQRKQQKAMAEAQEAEQWVARMQVANNDVALRLDQLPRLTIPRGPRAQVPADNERRELLAEHLRDIVNEANADLSLMAAVAEPELPEPAPSSPLGGELCKFCAGGCCTKGGNAAYLTPKTLRRVSAAAGLDSCNSLVATYLSYLPEQSMAGSCIYHTDCGCALPRELRSDICNDFVCDAFKALPTANSEPQQVLVLQRKQDNWQRLNLEAENEIVDALILSTSDGSLRL